MALTEVYVDPSINDDTGAGTSGDPYGDLEWAIEQETFDTTNGTRVNVKAGTTETLVADLSVAMLDTGTSIAWDSGDSAPIVVQGYTTTAGDGGKGAISGGGSISLFNSTSTNLQQLSFIDIDFSNSGSAAIIVMPAYTNAIRCSFATSSHANPIDFSTDAVVIGCSFTGFTGGGCIRIPQGFFYGNYVSFTGSGFGTCVQNSGQGTCIIQNNIIISGTVTQIGVIVQGHGVVCNNSIYSSVAGTSNAIQKASGRGGTYIFNNLIEGFSGTNGYAISVNNTKLSHWANSEYNCDGTVEILGTGLVVESDWGGAANTGLETLGASPFTTAGTDFSPVDTGQVKEGSVPDDYGDGAI